jgi:hypothetical protein
MAKKTVCPISRSEFWQKAEDLKVSINGQDFIFAEKKGFSTGSLGWYLNGKTTVDIGGKRVAVQIGLNLTIVGSKELPEDGEKTEAIAGIAKEAG